MKKFFRKLRDKFFLNAIKAVVSEQLAPLAETFTAELSAEREALSELAKGVSANESNVQSAYTSVTASISQLSQDVSALSSGLKSLADDIKLLDKKLFIQSVQNHYKQVREQVLERIQSGKKLRFASYIVYDSTFGAHGICELMLKEPEKYDVKFVICPDVYRDKDFSNYRKVKQTFVDRYGIDAVLDGVDEATCEFLDHSDKFDVVYLANPYDFLVNKVHGISYLCLRNILPIFICYGYIISKYFLNAFVASTEAGLFYKYFVETMPTLLESADYQLAKGQNLVLSGYPKMDSFANIKKTQNERKKILISPHHTVKDLGGDLQLSNFLEYSDFIAELPDLYPNIDFVFRPHPLLFTNLIMHKIWTQEQVDSYLKKLSKKMVYSNESDYLHLFAECDAIIHDCGSYMVEWLYTGKPCCYVVDSEEHTRSQFSKLANEALDHQTAIADSKEKIKEFIDAVQKNSFTNGISNWTKQNVMINYPNCSKFILDNLLK